ncbi:L,D-transpeptidase [Sinorhizobium garamanticum]|uniref:L,D-transpeptidase n=1 Tax=Sinorhizobium garamanticum TaxID=680247 RepID=A0ABY8DCA9_9HYPH|nr:L,D-transpeptidase [Sinorhizobium garamanticum]WEX87623.1 L,D-transpeptidase [Sinorhizobium garamanticum]
MCVSRNSAGRSAQLFALLLVSAVLAGCATSGQNAKPRGPDPYYVAMYGPKPEERFPLAATDISKVEPRFLRQQVVYPTSEPPGTIVVDTQNRFLYLVQDGGMALRYGIGVGKAGLEFQGEARVGRKVEWPRWTPTSDMVAREPERYGPLAGGMEPGIRNPLGPRALYLYQGNRDTLFRIHGTTEAWSIGKAVSSGCIRLFNPDIIDLYSRVPTDTRVVVLQSEPPMDGPLGVPVSAATNAGQPLPM